METFKPSTAQETHPGKTYVRPAHVLKDPTLTPVEKSLALQEWEDEEKALMRADDENMAAQGPQPGPPPSALIGEIHAAARKLDDGMELSTHPAVGGSTTSKEKTMPDNDEVIENKAHKKSARAQDILPETEALKEEINTLRSNVVGLARHIKDVSAGSASAAAEYVRDQVDGLKSTGAEALGKAEKRIRTNPGQSVAIAFAAGLLASYVFGRKA